LKDLFSFSIEAAVCGDLCAVNKKDNDHPNKLPFTGTLLIVDEASSRPPNGSDGHRILVPKDVAKKNLESLIGMGLNYQPGKLSSHQPRHKVGVISKAWIDGNKVMCSGTIWKKDFPDAQRELKANGLGMSMELANVLVKNKHDTVWKLVDFHFTGATVLYKNAAAYQKTSLAAASAELEYLLGGYEMATSKVKTKNKHKSSGNGQLTNLVTLLSSSMTKAIKDGLKPFGEKLESISASVEDHGKAIGTLAAASQESKESISAAADSSETESVEAGADSETESVEASDDLEAAGDSSDTAKKKKKKIHAAKDDESSDDDDSSSDSDDSDLDAELEKLSAPAKGTKAGPDEESADPELGKLNKNAKNKGRKNSVNASSVAILASRANSRIKTMKAEMSKLREKVRKKDKRVKAIESELEEVQAQVADFTEKNMGPRSLPSDVRMLLAKGGYDVGELSANGTKLTVSQVDELLAATGVTLSPTERMAAKNHLLEHGYMEMGEMNRFERR
jgi:hypothetical protein